MVTFCIKQLLVFNGILLSLSAPQQPEINDQFEKEAKAKEATTVDEFHTKADKVVNYTKTTIAEPTNHPETDKPKDHRIDYNHYNEYVAITKAKPSIIETFYEILTRPVVKFISAPKVSFVLRNIGTCIVNGAMEIISYYFPAPLIPLIASAAGMMIPFEPVVMLRERMPVTSYRRAFRKAMSSFLNTFDGYKLDNYDEDPYMTRRFNRRFMNGASGENKKRS